MLKKVTLFLLIFSFQYVDAQIKLNQNTGNTLVETGMPSCEKEESWGRIFKLSDFGVGPNEQFIICSGQIGLSKSNSGASLSINVFSFTDLPPQGSNVLRPTLLLGSRGIGQAPVIDGEPEIVQADFDEPIVVPAGVDRILVSVSKNKDYYNPASAEITVAGTDNDTGDSWYTGCDVAYTWTATTFVMML